MTVIHKAWSDIGPNDKVIWVLPNQVRHGVVVERKDRSLVVAFWEEDRPRAIPDARWYYVNYRKDPHATEALYVVDEFPETLPSIPTVDRDRDNDFLYAFQLAELLNMDEKQIRRHLRNGVFPTAFRSKLDNRWQVMRRHALEVANKRGWI